MRTSAEPRSRSVAIRVAGLGKHYRLGAQRARYKSLRDLLAEAASAPFRAFRRGAAGRTSRPPAETIWALHDVSFEVGDGEVVGVIGRNGAGKSTLLKILSRITDPSRGEVEIHGRVGSLLEVGTGFHPELTGRENIVLNGVILGMKRREVDRKFDEIVSFAEVEKFIDTPVKHYSSGMYLRLAFSVAAHLEPEVLLVDEVLAVGDANFQRKCLDKMEEVGRRGRTVLFVSHNMPSITRLCERTILLEGGGVLKDGPSHEVVGAYLSSGAGTAGQREWPDLAKAPGNSVVRLRRVRTRTESGGSVDAADIRMPLGIEMQYDVLEPGWVLYPVFEIFNDQGIRVFDTIDSDAAWRGRPRRCGSYTSTAWIPGNLLSEGTHFVHAEVSTFNPLTEHVYERDAVAFQVVDSLDGDSARGDYAGSMSGAVRPLLKWTTVAPDGAEGRR